MEQGVNNEYDLHVKISRSWRKLYFFKKSSIASTDRITVLINKQNEQITLK